jgi:hypothetical protein
VTVAQSAGIELVKKADPTVVHAAGDTVSYGFTVTNSGTVSLHDVAVTEKEFSGSGTLSAINCPGTTLAPHASLVCTATYRVTKQDVAAGVITNTAVATGVTGRAAAAGFAAIAPGTTVTSKASSARVIVEQPSPSGSGTSAPAGPTTSPSTDNGNDNDNEGVSTTGAAVIPLALLAGVLLIVGAGVLTVGRKRRHG